MVVHNVEDHDFGNFCLIHPTVCRPGGRIVPGLEDQAVRVFDVNREAADQSTCEKMTPIRWAYRYVSEARRGGEHGQAQPDRLGPFRPVLALHLAAIIQHLRKLVVLEEDLQTSTYWAQSASMVVLSHTSWPGAEMQSLIGGFPPRCRDSEIRSAIASRWSLNHSAGLSRYSSTFQL